MLKLWSSDQTRVEEAQQLALALARVNSEAALGRYDAVRHCTALSGSRCGVTWCYAYGTVYGAGLEHAATPIVTQT